MGHATHRWSRVNHAPVFSPLRNACRMPPWRDMSHRESEGTRRRASALSARASREKLERARRLSPAERLLLAMELSDICHGLQRALCTRSFSD